MSEETKEILYLENYISKYKDDEKSIINGNRLTTPAMLDYLEVKSILNYITNLQKENEKYKSSNKKTIELLKSLQEKYGYMLEDVIFLLLQGGDE